MNPRSGHAAPGGDHGDQSPRGRRGAEAWAAARSRIGAALIPCRTIERERDCRIGGCIIKPRGRVYIDVQGPSWSARQDTRSISILDVSYCTYTLKFFLVELHY
jgi:hypothetical protein